MFFVTLLCCLLIFSSEKSEGGEFYGAIEALYWKPTHTPITAGREIGPDAGGLRPRENLLIEGEFDWGVRVQAGYDACDFFIDAAYLYYDSDSRSNFSAAPGSVIRMPSGASTDTLSDLTSELEWKYQNVDVRYGHFFVRNQCWQFYGFLNARWVDISFRNLDTGIRIAPAVNPDTFLQESDYCAGGLGIGLGGAYNLCGNIEIKGSFGGMIFYGNKNENAVRFFETDIPNPLMEVNESPNCYSVPGLQFNLGIGYPFCFQCIQFALEVGYQLDYYFDIIRHNVGIDRNFDDDVPVLTYFNAGFGGPYLRLSGRF